jgi:hypothetical protein
MNSRQPGFRVMEGVVVAPSAAFVAVALIAVAILDVMSTNAGLHAGAVEANPLMAFAQTTFGVWWFAPKMAMTVVAAAIVLWKPVRAVLSCVGAVVVFNAFVVLNNFSLAGIV